MAINDTVIHEFDVLRWLLDDNYVSAQVVGWRRPKHSVPAGCDPVSLARRYTSRVGHIHCKNIRPAIMERV